MKNITKSKKKIKSQDALRKVYSKIPGTKGCMENLEQCKAWCCRLQSPQLLYCEFTNTWAYVLKHWTVDAIVDLIGKALSTYLSNKPTKGCIFWDSTTKLCRCHKTRPLACRLYGIESDEEFKPKYERLKALYKDNQEAVVMDQCKLVSTINGCKLCKKDTDNWWNELKEVEQSVGIKKRDITDEVGGSYRTFHDHILLHLFPEQMMENFTTVRTLGTPEEKKNVVDKYTAALKGVIEKLAGGEK